MLRLDPGTRARLAKLDGRVLRIELSRPELVLVLIVADARVSVPVRHDGEADLVLAGSLAALRSLGTSSDAIHRGEVTIRGDLGVASALREVIGGFDLDPVEIVSPLLGDTLAHKLGRALRGSGSWLRRSRGAFGENAREYLEEEAELVATRPEVERFCTEVDAIARAGDRLASRLARLERAGDRGYRHVGSRRFVISSAVRFARIEGVLVEVRARGSLPARHARRPTAPPVRALAPRAG